MVVNCFHFSVSLGYKTTIYFFVIIFFWLWIAFIFQYLWDTKQPATMRKETFGGCELLSFFSIFGIQNNIYIKKSNYFTVVNCFHFSVSLGYKTTRVWKPRIYLRLWIAFIFQYLWDTKQHDWILDQEENSCELLSFFSIFGIQNNHPKTSTIYCRVVNCFHFSVSLGYKTTFRTVRRRLTRLWIAFIFQYLWDTKQRGAEIFSYAQSCELLSFFSIFGIQNNLFAHHIVLHSVVNCFHFSVSLGYKTTCRMYV